MNVKAIRLSSSHSLQAVDGACGHWKKREKEERGHAKLHRLLRVLRYYHSAVVAFQQKKKEGETGERGSSRSISSPPFVPPCAPSRKGQRPKKKKKEEGEGRRLQSLVRWGVSSGRGCKGDGEKKGEKSRHWLPRSCPAEEKVKKGKKEKKGGKSARLVSAAAI